MKSILLAIVLCAAPYFASAQGTVTFSNNGGAGVTNAFTGNLQPVGGTLLLALYGGTNLATLVQLGAPVSIAPIPGFFAGGTRTNTLATPGQPALFQVKAWDSAYGSTYEQFLLNAPADALQGVSATFTSLTASPVGAPPPTPVSLVGSFPGMVLVPEPTTYALGALGLGLIWMAKRRRE